MEFINEVNETPVVGRYDVIVIGGGMAGVGAALGARRNGCKVLIIEKSVMLGGLATLGFIAYYLPLCDGRGRKVTGGIAEELLHLSIKYGYDTLAPEWRDGKGVGTRKRYTTRFSPPEFVYALDELMLAEGIDLMFDTVCCRPVMAGDVCEAVIVENKSGRSAYRADMFVDASGDADLFFRAGAECAEEKNYLAYWFYNTSLEKMQQALIQGSVMAGISLEWRGSFAKDGAYSLGEKAYRGTRAEEIIRFILNGRKTLREQIEKNRAQKGSLLALPGIAQFRRTRRVKGLYLLTEKDVHKQFEDTIGCTGHWLKPGIVYEIPYRTLVTRTLANVFAAGRIISAADDAWEATRVIPPSVLTGQAAGTAAALAIKQDCPVTEVVLSDLQKRLQQTGVILHPPA